MVAAATSRGDRLVLVTHSLGSVIALDGLAARPD
jgi:predicted alpha/beta hydrolase family esterase